MSNAYDWFKKKLILNLKIRVHVAMALYVMIYPHRGGHGLMAGE